MNFILFNYLCYILKDIFSFISLNKIYSLIRYNKTFQKKFNINLKNYKLLYENNLTKIVVIIKNNKKPTDRYININNKKKEKYYHLYVNYDAIESNNYFNEFIILINLLNK